MCARAEPGSPVGHAWRDVVAPEGARTPLLHYYDVTVICTRAELWVAGRCRTVGRVRPRRVPAARAPHRAASSRVRRRYESWRVRRAAARVFRDGDGFGTSHRAARARARNQTHTHKKTRPKKQSSKDGGVDPEPAMLAWTDRLRRDRDRDVMIRNCTTHVAPTEQMRWSSIQTNPWTVFFPEEAFFLPVRSVVAAASSSRSSAPSNSHSNAYLGQSV